MDHRDNHGRFGQGNQFAKGHPSNAKAQAVRAALIDSATPERMKTLIEQLWRDADDRDPEVRAPARKELLDRIVGKPPQSVTMDATVSDGVLANIPEDVAVELLADAIVRLEDNGALPAARRQRALRKAKCPEKSPQNRP